MDGLRVPFQQLHLNFVNTFWLQMKYSSAYVKAYQIPLVNTIVDLVRSGEANDQPVRHQNRLDNLIPKNRILFNLILLREK